MLSRPLLQAMELLSGYAFWVFCLFFLFQKNFQGLGEVNKIFLRNVHPKNSHQGISTVASVYHFLRVVHRDINMLTSAECVLHSFRKGSGAEKGSRHIGLDCHHTWVHHASFQRENSSRQRFSHSSLYSSQYLTP